MSDTHSNLQKTVICFYSYNYNVLLRAFTWQVFSIVVQDTGLHYDHYLREVIDFLEKDEHFREKLRNTDMEDIKVMCFFSLFVLSCSYPVLTLMFRHICLIQQGKLAKELDFVSHHIRTKLDELKRQEVNRLRTLIKAKQDLEGGNGALGCWMHLFSIYNKVLQFKLLL